MTAIVSLLFSTNNDKYSYAVQCIFLQIRQLNGFHITFDNRTVFFYGIVFVVVQTIAFEIRWYFVLPKIPEDLNGCWTRALCCDVQKWRWRKRNMKLLLEIAISLNRSRSKQHSTDGNAPVLTSLCEKRKKGKALLMTRNLDWNVICSTRYFFGMMILLSFGKSPYQT